MPFVYRTDWGAADFKVEREDSCRVCTISGRMVPLFPVHTISAEKQNELLNDSSPAPWVHPDAVIPMCELCKEKWHGGEVNLVGRLTLEEEMNAIWAAGGMLQAAHDLAGITRKLRLEEE